MTFKLKDLAKTIRSKNAGSYMITLEVLFDDRKVYEKVKKNGSISLEIIASAYGIDTSEVINFMYYDPGMGIKANLRRLSPSGGPGESDIYGCQQYAPLMDLEIYETKEKIVD